LKQNLTAYQSQKQPVDKLNALTRAAGDMKQLFASLGEPAMYGESFKNQMATLDASLHYAGYFSQLRKLVTELDDSQLFEV
jgi:hypothetical protein